MADKIEKSTESFERFYAFFTRWQENSGKTQKEIAPLMGMTQGALSRFLRHKKPIAINTMEEFASAINMDLLDILAEGRAILAGEEPAPPTKAPRAAITPEREMELLRKLEAKDDKIEELEQQILNMQAEKRTEEAADVERHAQGTAQHAEPRSGSGGAESHSMKE